MVKVETNGKTFDLEDLSQGQLLEVRDSASVWDPISERYKVSAAILNREFYKACVKDSSGKPIDIYNKEQMSRKEFMAVDKELQKIISLQDIKNG